MTSTIERTRPKQRKSVIREVCLVGDRSRRYVHTPLPDLGQGSPGRDRAVAVERRGLPCPTV